MRLSSTQLEGSEQAAPAVRFADEVHQRGPRPPRPGSAARRAEAGAYAELLGLLEWSDDEAGHAGNRRTRAALERTHLEAVAGRVNSRLPAHVLLELEALPDDAYLTLVRSPEVFHAAFHAPPQDLAKAMQRFIAVERARLGALTRLDGTARAAGCDRVVRAEGGVIVAIDELPRLDPGGPGPRPVLDTASELPTRLLTRFPDRMLVTPSESETAAARDKLERAWALLRQVSPLAHQLVGDLTQVVCVRTALEDPRFYTASDATTIGVVHFGNAHLPRKLPCEVASELVHESIHQTLFRWEQRHPLLADRHVATAKVRSPWTGAVLDVYAFLHACFVWYGVANLWRLPSAPDDLAVLRQRRAAEAGFAQRPLERLGRHRHALSAELQAAIEEMTEDVAPI